MPAHTMDGQPNMRNISFLTDLTNEILLILDLAPLRRSATLQPQRSNRLSQSAGIVIIM